MTRGLQRLVSHIPQDPIVIHLIKGLANFAGYVVHPLPFLPLVLDIQPLDSMAGVPFSAVALHYFTNSLSFVMKMTGPAVC